MPPSPSSSTSSLIAALDDAAESSSTTFDWAGMRERRLQELVAESKVNERIGNDDRKGRVNEWDRGEGEEKELMRSCAKEKFCIIHFYHPDFPRCQIMDKHLEAIAPSHPLTLFYRVHVSKAPFLTHRLGVKVLPCVVLFLDGVAVDRVVGFDEIGNTDKFATAVLETRLKASGVLPPPSQHAHLRSLLSSSARRSDDEDEDDEDAEDTRSGRGKGRIGGIRNGVAGRGKGGRGGGGGGEGSDSDWD